VKFRFKFRDPAAKGLPNVNCMSPGLLTSLVCLTPWSGPETFDVDGQ
jgi:hypothetical protein